MSLLGSALGGLGLGGLVDGGLNLLGQRYLQDRGQEKQYQYNATMMQNKHQWEVEDLKKAGLNPILSANSGAGIAGVGSGGGSSPGFSLSKSSVNAKQVQQLNETLKSQRETTKKLRAEASEAEANSALKKAEKDWILSNPNNMDMYMRSKILGTSTPISAANVATSAVYNTGKILDKATGYSNFVNWLRNKYGYKDKQNKKTKSQTFNVKDFKNKK